MHDKLTPAQITAELDRHIIGQHAAKRAVAIALRNRYRRRQLPADLADEVIPKNILMIGPTGVGKTEIARRLAKLAQSPFVKVEATKFTEVGYVGRDVESMVRDIVDAAIRMVEEEHAEQVRDEARRRALDRILEALSPAPQTPQEARELPPHLRAMHEFAAKMGLSDDDVPVPEEPTEEQRRAQREQVAAAQTEAHDLKEQLRPRLARGELDAEEVTIEVEEARSPVFNIWGGQGEELIRLEDAMGGMMPRQSRRRTMSVAEAIEVLTREEADQLLDQDKVTRDAINRAENDGIIFIDELDKICGHGPQHGPDVSREGVQRDILPVVEGTTVMTKHGPVDTRHMLFIAAGAFHVSKPSDLIPELQGRFPIRVELENLGQEDLRRILAEPKHSLLKQYQALLGTEGVTVDFQDEAIDELATIAMRVNDQTENIGARRLHTILEKLLDELSFAAPDIGATTVTITREYVQRRLSEIVADQDLSRYIL